MAEFKDRLRQLLARKRVTQKEIALACGVSSQAVSGWLAGTLPKPAHLDKLSAYLDVSSHYLLHGDLRLVRELHLHALMAEICSLNDEEINLLVMVARQLNKPRT